jgi:septum formation protein
MAAFYLASSSPRRRELLQQIGVRFETLVLRGGQGRAADVDERLTPGERAEDYSLRIALEKAQAGMRAVQTRVLVVKPVLAADTIVVLDGEILGKPESIAQAAEFLHRLSGRTHEVHSVVALAAPAGRATQVWTAGSVSKVSFKPLSDAEIEHYCATGEPSDKAGGYAIQGRAALFVERLEGSYSGVVGLPLYETAQLLNKAGIRVL